MPPTAVTSESHRSWYALPARSTILFWSSAGQATGKAVAVASAEAEFVVDDPVCEDVVVVTDEVVLIVVVVVVAGALVWVLFEGAYIKPLLGLVQR